MKALKLIITFVFLGAASLYGNAWKPSGDRLMTEWGERVTPENVWQSYPRPQLRRSDWQNLNGIWDCAITSKDSELGTVDFDKEILVPFCVESSLSGIGITFTPSDKIWYRRGFNVPSSWKGRDIILHFGAVDYEASVYVNGKLAGTHKGGNNAFSLNITDYVKRSGQNILTVEVVDPTNEVSCTRGKQTLKPGGIMYTAVSGIWKTVWMEPVSPTSILRVSPSTDIYAGTVDFNVELRGARGTETVKVNVYDGGSVPVYSAECPADAVSALIHNPVLWTPDSPKLYGVQMILMRSGKVLDKVDTYCAFREVSKKNDEFGNARFCLNGKPLFQWGPLDQGWWPDGLLTPPSEEAMLYDMVQLKKMGFNMIRKHIKVEPELYYYYADSLGIMLLQDMPSANRTPGATMGKPDPKYPEDWQATPEHEAQYKYEFAEMVDNLKFFPCITTWIIFNEAWGQFRTRPITDWVYGIASGRLVNSVTGWDDRGVGDFFDIHNYPYPSMKTKEECRGRISSLGEFGGLGFRVSGHLWNEQKGGWGYRQMEGQEQLASDFEDLVYNLEPLVAMGLSAAVYTQTSDVETEINGLMTYDRAVTKIDPSFINALSDKLYSVPFKQPVTLVERTKGMKISKIKPGCTSSWSQEFEWDGNGTELSLWHFTGCKAVISINGVQIYNGPMKRTRNYSHLNISQHIKLLKRGSNTIEFILENDAPKAEQPFDFSLTKF